MRWAIFQKKHRHLNSFNRMGQFETITLRLGTLYNMSIVMFKLKLLLIIHHFQDFHFMEKWILTDNIFCVRRFSCNAGVWLWYFYYNFECFVIHLLEMYFLYKQHSSAVTTTYFQDNLLSIKNICPLPK